MKKLLCLILLLCLLLCACGAQNGGATGSDLTRENETQPASGSDVVDLAALALRRDLLAGGGAWRSEQQAPGDDGEVVRELRLLDDGSFSYREGDAYSEFCYFAAGTWAVEDEAIRVEYRETDEYGTAYAEQTETALYLVHFDNGELVLTLETETGFCDAQPGQNVYYYSLRE